MQVNHSEVAVASRIGTASATCPVLRILSVIVFVNAVALMACRSEKLLETPSITFTKFLLQRKVDEKESTRSLDGSERLDQSSRLLFMRTAGNGGCSPGRLTSDRDGDR
jgi:hypothetical protein